MSDWLVTWWDGNNLRQAVVFADVYNVVNTASGQGVHTWAIIKIERIPKP
jgi:hypothetical protein